MPPVRRTATRLIEGVERFQKGVFGTKEALFQELEKGQSPGVLFITCSDSRIDPNLLTLTDPGDLFVLRNAGNIIPAAGGPVATGEMATIEYAVAALKVKDIIICGHSKCGAVGALIAGQPLDALPSVQEWLGHSVSVVEEVERLGTGLSPADRLNLAVERNVLLQLSHLRTHPAVATAINAGLLRLHGWIYHFEDGRVLAHDPAHERFVPVADATRQGWGVGTAPKAE